MNRVALYARYSSENQRDACIEDQLRQCRERTEREGRAKRLHLTNRPVTLLSGLLTCGCCGGRISMVMSDRYACRNHLRKGICNNARTIRRDEIETRMLAGLKEKLVSSEAVAEAVCGYAKETNRLNRAPCSLASSACSDRICHWRSWAGMTRKSGPRRRPST